MGWLRRMPFLVVATLVACAGRSPPGLGVRDGRLAVCPDSPNCVSSQATDDRHRIAPLAFRGTADEGWARLREVLSARPDTRLVDSQADYLRVEFRTRLGFVDDGEFALDREARVIHVRSASRVGYSDLGKNRSRLGEIRQALEGTL